jgi:hypothetical protein
MAATAYISHDHHKKSKQKLLESSLLSAKECLGADELAPLDEAVSADLSRKLFEHFLPFSFSVL